MRPHRIAVGIALLAAFAAGCGAPGDAIRPARASGYVEATDVRVASKVAGRVASVTVQEGQRVEAGAVVATLSPVDIDLALARIRAERAQAEAQLNLLLRRAAAGRHPAQAEAQAAAASADQRAAETELASARIDEARFQQLMDRNAGVAKQRDDAVARRQLAEARVHAAAERLSAAKSTVERVKAGRAARRDRRGARQGRRRWMPRPRFWNTTAPKRRSSRPIGGHRGVAPRRARRTGRRRRADRPRGRSRSRVGERLRRGDTGAAGATSISPPRSSRTPAIGSTGRVSFISPKAEFTPRNVQTANERAKLVYRDQGRRGQQQGRAQARHAGGSRSGPDESSLRPWRP